MEIREFAESLLFSPDLEAKLFFPQEAWSDNTPGELLKTPSFPTRPKSLTPRGEKSSIRFKSLVAHVEKERERGLLLHYFANHELLAFELMALMLLKFPQAPKEFRHALLQTIREEQNHLRMYLQRMGEFGIEFGDLPVNEYFWRSMSPIQDLKQYASMMSLTFEQANLDHCLYFGSLFKKIGDLDSMNIIKKVYEDEVGHVRQGLIWLKKWGDPQKTLWENYIDHLIFPTTPARAKGFLFSTKARERVGFPEEYTQHLETYSASKGRASNVYYFNPLSEIYMLNPKFFPSRRIKSQTADLEPMLVFLCRQDDIFLSQRKPSSEFLRHLKSAGVSSPEWIEVDLMEKKERQLGFFCPWGWDPHSMKVYESLKRQINNFYRERMMVPSVDSLKKIFSKAWSLELARELVETKGEESILNTAQEVGVLCKNNEEAQEAISSIWKTKQSAVVKPVYGFSGQNFIIFSQESDLEERGLALKHLIERQGCVVIEPWLNKIAEFSFQIEVDHKGETHFLGLNRFLTGEKGRYRGAIIGRFEEGIDRRTVSTLHKFGILDFAQELTEFVGKKLYQQGYSGYAGIDAFAYADQGEIRLKPIVEINPRNNMGRITLEMKKKIPTGRVGLWLVLGKKELPSGINFQKFGEILQKNFPLEMKNAHQIKCGVLMTSDWTQAEEVMSFLYVGRSLDIFRNWLTEQEIAP